MPVADPLLSTQPLTLDHVSAIEAWLPGTGLQAPIDGVIGWRRMIEDPRIHCVVAIHPTAGVVGFYRLDAAPDGSAEITLVVAADRRRRGIGGWLLEAVLEAARGLGFRQIVAVVAHGGRDTHKFFVAAGFEQTDGEPPGFVRFERLIHTGGRVEPLEITL